MEIIVDHHRYGNTQVCHKTIAAVLPHNSNHTTAPPLNHNHHDNMEGYPKKTTPDGTEKLTMADNLQIQNIVGDLLHFFRTVKDIIRIEPSALANQKNEPTEQTTTMILQLLYYRAMNPDACMHHYTRNIITNLQRPLLSHQSQGTESHGEFF